MTVLAPAPPDRTARPTARPEVRGKFLWRGEEKLYLRGVTYGTFAPNQAGEPFPESDVVARDFEMMQANGINTLRTYTPPPRWLLDEAERHGLLVLVGLPWEQHVAFLDDARPRQIEAGLRAMVRGLKRHPALLGFAVGNEIPADIVRWYGNRRVERFLARLLRAVKDEDPEALTTYVNYPTTEYLQLPFADFMCFNVYLEERERFESYLARLQTLAADRPLVMAEIGLDSRRNGLALQGETLDWQVRSVFGSGCAGCFVFAWTDEWHRGGAEVDDWDFGVVNRVRQPKPALAQVSRAFDDVPFPQDRWWPRVTVAICTHNGARTLADALDGALALDYPDYEVVVVDDGSTDRTPEVASRIGVRLIRTQNTGLSAARNTAWRAANGEVVAYLDDDARPDPQWLRYLTSTLIQQDLTAVGGPNLAPPGDGLVAACVANAPGGPTHVLLDDVIAEHVPGCNMAFKRGVLEEVGGFDPRFRAAGDDVDMCWRAQARGYRIGFSPAALVWHHRRNNLGAYWRQQQGYGKAESLLEEKWPERYNRVGHLRWDGVIYGKGLVQPLGFRNHRIYHGLWGSAPFQPMYQRRVGVLEVPAMPEWYLLLAALVVVGLLGWSWPILMWAWPLVGVVVTIPVLQALSAAREARFEDAPSGTWEEARRRGLVAILHLMQPLARLKGRLQHGLAPWRRRGFAPWIWPSARAYEVWSESWRAPHTWLEGFEEQLRAAGGIAERGGPYHSWDLQVRGGLFGSARAVAMLEEHGDGRQMWRLRVTPVPHAGAILLLATCAPLGILAFAAGGVLAGYGLSLLALLLAGRVVQDGGLACGLAATALDQIRQTRRRDAEERAWIAAEPTGA